MAAGIAGFALHGAPRRIDRFVAPALLIQDHCKIQMRSCKRRIDRDRPIEHGHGLGMTAVRSVPEAIEDFRRLKEMGFKGVMMPGSPATAASVACACAATSASSAEDREAASVSANSTVLR